MAPEPSVDNQRADQACPDAHVLHELDMDRGDATQARRPHIDRMRFSCADQRRRRVIGIHDDAGAGRHRQIARLFRNVAGREVVAEISLHLRRTRLGDHLAVPRRIEAVHHDPVISGEVAYQFDRSVEDRRKVAFVSQGGDAAPQRIEHVRVRSVGHAVGLDIDQNLARLILVCASRQRLSAVRKGEEPVARSRRRPPRDRQRRRGP